MKYFIESMFLFFLLGLAFVVLWGIALIDILKSDFKDGATKIVWLLVVVFLSIFGLLLYYLIGRGQKKLSRPAQTFIDV